MTNVLPTYPRSKLEFTHGAGSYLYTKSGEKFLDFGTGIAVNSLGYSNPYLNDKLKEQRKSSIKPQSIEEKCVYTSVVDKSGMRILADAIRVHCASGYHTCGRHRRRKLPCEMGPGPALGV